MTLAITYFASLRSSQGKRYRTTWTRLIERLSASPRVVADKHDAPGFSLATFVEDRRAEARVEFVYAVGLDLDEQVDWEELTCLFDKTDSFLHTTWSSTTDAPRARLFMRLSRSVTGAEYRRVYAAVTSKVEERGIVVDRKASDPSRFWFLPSIAPGGTYRYSVGRGKPVNVEGALAVVPPPPELPPAPPPPSGPRLAGDVEARARAYLEKCPPAISGQGGHTTTFLVAQRLVRGFALDEATALALMREWNRHCDPPWKEGDLRRKIRQAAERGVMPAGALRDADRRAS